MECCEDQIIDGRPISFGQPHLLAAGRGSKSDRRCVLDRHGGARAFAFTYDHLVPLEIGEADGCDNLWPQPRAEAKRKDELENALQAQV